MRARKSMLTLIAGAALAALIIVPTAAAAKHQGPGHQKEVVMKTGKKGEIHLRTTSKAGPVVLEPGNYRIQHRVEANRHYVRFVPIGRVGPAQEVPCQLELLDKKARFTAVSMIADGAVNRITRVQVKGERSAHAF